MSELPDGVELVIAAKSRTPEEVIEAIEAGAKNIGENYVQEAELLFKKLPEEIVNKVKWHMIGSLQKNKVNKALKIFDMIQTIDSIELAQAFSQRAEKEVAVLMEVNIGGEESKSGTGAEKLEELIKKTAVLKNIRIKGLMAMEPYFKDPEEARPYFKKMKEIFEKIKKANIPNVDLKVLSMGMSNSYKVAIEEGSSMVRIGTAIFGARK